MLRTLSLLAALALTPAASAQDWTVDYAASSVGFETEAFGSTAQGEFTDWTAEIRLDPADLSTARIEATVLTASGDTGNGSFNDAMLGEAGLAPDRHAEARFVAEDIRQAGTVYEAHGQLLIKGTAQDVILPFSLSIEGGRAVAEARLGIARMDFGVGDGSWGDTASQVSIVLHIEADAAD